MPTLSELQQIVKDKTNILSSSLSFASTALADLNRCKCGKGNIGTNKSCRPLTRTYSFGEIASLSECKTPDFSDKCVSDCCKESTCKDRVTAYNNSINSYNTAKEDLKVAQTALDNFVATDPSAQEQIKNNESDIAARSSTLKYLGVTAVIVLTIFVIRTFVIKNKN